MSVKSDTNYLQLIFIVIAIITFVPGLLTNYADKYLPEFVLQFIRYGRANVPKSGEGYSILKKIEVPKKWFYHVYIYAIFLQSIIIYTIFSSYNNPHDNQKYWLHNILQLVGGNARPQSVNATTTTVVAVLFWLQLCRRLYETCFVCVYSNTKMNLMHYGLTWLHYTGCMLTVPAYGPLFSSPRGNDDTRISILNMTVPQFFGILLFMYGSWVQYSAHVGLADLRKGKGNQIVTLKHQIPRGGNFEIISCPNYWGEILVYTSIALIFCFQNCTWNYIALWVTANQIITGLTNHKWYLNTFPDYPKNRKAVIPFVW